MSGIRIIGAAHLVIAPKTQVRRFLKAIAVFLPGQVL
jgi:hypothetical protein